MYSGKRWAFRALSWQTVWLWTFLKYRGRYSSCGATALKAGVDVGLWDESFSRLGEAVEKGLVDEKLLDEAVLRVLELKFKRGLFEHPYMEENMLEAEEAGINAASLKLARESAVLLKNEKQVLPAEGSL